MMALLPVMHCFIRTDFPIVTLHVAASFNLIMYTNIKITKRCIYSTIHILVYKYKLSEDACTDMLPQVHCKAAKKQSRTNFFSKNGPQLRMGL